MEPENFTFTFKGMANADYGVVVGVKPIYQYDKEKGIYTQQVIGKRVKLVLPSQSYEKIDVVLPADTITSDIQPDTKVTFEGFEARLCRNYNSGDYFFSCKAQKIVIVK